MLSARDRLLAALFAFQLVVAAVLGGYLVHALGGRDRVVTVQQAAVVPGAAVPAATAGPRAGSVAAPGAPGTGRSTTGTAAKTAVPGTARAGTPGRTVTTTSGGGAVSGGRAASTTALAVGAPIRVGAVVSQTGAINFVSSAQATKAYFDRVNRAGGVNGHKIVLDLRDDQLDQTRGKQQAQQLVSEGVFAFTGWNAPNTENDIVSFLEQNQVPLIGAYGEQGEYHSRYAYAFSASYGHYGFQMGVLLAEQGVKKPGLVYLDNNSAKANEGLIAAFKAGFASKGVTLSDSEVVKEDITHPSYDDLVTQFRVDGVDGFASLLDQTAYNRLLQSQDRQGYHPPHAADSLFLDGSVHQSASTDGVFVATDYDFVDGGGPAVQDYARTVRAQFGSSAQVNYFGEQGWVDASVFVAAVKAMGTDISRAKLLTAMDGLSGRGGFGFTSDLAFGDGVRDLNRCIKFGKVVGGRISRITDWRCDSQPF